MFENCLFCPQKLFLLNQVAGLPCEQSIVYEDINLFITPDIAPIIPGHFLIISKPHFSCFGKLDKEARRSLDNAKLYLRKKLPNCIFLEHGSAIDNTAGASIDHAHLHAMPLEGLDIKDEIVNSRYVTFENQSNDDNILVQYAKNNQPYLYYEDAEGERKVFGITGHLPSQFFRNIVASHFSMEFDWKKMYSTEESKALFYDTLLLAQK